MTDQLFIDAKLENLSDALDWAREEARRAGFSASEMRKIELALEEAIVNIIKHAYRNYSGQIDLKCQSDATGIQFTIKDKGPPFDPLKQVQKTDYPVTLDDKKEGGLGIFLIRHYMDIVHYERQEPYNVLRLRKNFS